MSKWRKDRQNPINNMDVFIEDTRKHIKIIMTNDLKALKEKLKLTPSELWDELRQDIDNELKRRK